MKIPIFITIPLVCIKMRDTRIIDFFAISQLRVNEVDENCKKDVLLGLIHSVLSLLLSIFFPLKYNKINRLPNNLGHSVY